MIEIILNGGRLEIKAGLSVDSFLQAAGYVASDIAVALNGVFVPRQDYESVVIVAGDAVEVVAPMQGG